MKQRHGIWPSSMQCPSVLTAGSSYSPRSAGGDEVVPPQDSSSEIQVRRAADTGTAGGRTRLSAPDEMMMETRGEVRDAHGQDMLHRD